jgi:hypothetical protein
MTQNRKQLLAGLVKSEHSHFGGLFDQGLSMELTIKWLQASKLNHNNDSHADIVLNGYLDLFMGRCTQQTPETFIFDGRRLAELRDTLQDISIMSSAMIIFQQWAGSCHPRMLEEMKWRLAKVLGTHNAMMYDIAAQMLLVLSRILGPVNSDRRKLLYATVDRLIDPEHHIYKMLRERLRTVVKSFILSGACPVEMLKRNALSSVREELETLLPKIKLLWVVNWKVHGDRYKLLLDQQ